MKHEINSTFESGAEAAIPADVLPLLNAAIATTTAFATGVPVDAAAFALARLHAAAQEYLKARGLEATVLIIDKPASKTEIN